MSVCLSPLSDCLAPAPSHTIQPHGTLFRCFFRPPTLPLSTTQPPLIHPPSAHLRQPLSTCALFFFFLSLFFFCTDPRGHRDRFCPTRRFSFWRDKPPFHRHRFFFFFQNRGEGTCRVFSPSLSRIFYLTKEKETNV